MTDRRLKLEPLERRLLLAADFGDAPSPYDTLLADNGARHEAVGPMLGTSRDSETDGLPTLNADGDGSDDGVTFGVMRAGQLDASITVNVQNAPLGAKLDAWIDFNGDRVWDTITERIAGSIIVNNGDNTIRFAVPANISLGEKYARFRLSSDGGLLPGGIAPDGEVEDYLVTIETALSTLGFVAPTEIAITAANPASIQVGDLDRDGDQDLIFSTNSNSIYWLESRSTGDSVEHLVASSVNIGTIMVADIDLDGDLDIVGSNGVLTWYENDGNQVYTPRVIDTPNANPTSVNFADLDGDGDLDILAASPSLTVAWYENNGSMTFTERIVTNKTFGADGVHTVYPVDMDRDGDLDLVIGANGFFGEFAWYENNGSQLFTERTILPSRKPSAVFPIDFDRDGDMDIAYALNDASTDSIGWLENNGSQGFTFRTISNDVVDPTSIFVADLNGDGHMDVLTSSSNRRSVDLFLGSGGQTYAKTALLDTSGGFNMASPAVVDIDGDGDLDIFAGRNKTMLRFEAYPGPIRVAASIDAFLEDSSTSSTITFTRTGDTSAEETFPFTVLGSATYGTDYSLAGATTFDGTAGSITFLAGERTATLTITPVADADFEENETITIRIADYADIGLPAQPDNPTDAVVTILHDEPADFGDAADTYLTTAASNGPSHGATGPTLGATRDAESDGLPTQLADGDGADDDGVTFGTLHAGQQDAVIRVNVQNAPTGARLDAWFDFDGDGNFLGPDEQVVTSVLVIEGDNVLPIDIPATARSGETTVRFRLSTAGGLSYVGYSVDGEVEDYRVTISPPAAADGVFSARPPISTSTIAARDVAAADLDGDGDVDLVSSGSGLIDWHESVGNGQFVTHNIAAVTADEIKVIDLDRDGDLDLVAALSSSIAWFENDGSESFIQHQLTGYLPSATEVLAADMDSDGDLDLVALGGNVYSNGALVWFENLGDDSFSSMITIGETERTDTFALGDVNGDDHIDIVAAANTPQFFQLTLFVNDGNAKFSRVAVDFPLSNTTSIEIADLDGDADGDIVVCFGVAVAWLENNGTGDFSTWTFIEPFLRTSDVKVADVDGDGATDLIAISQDNNHAYWYRNDGAADPTFSSLDVGTTSRSPSSIAVGDLDGDGDLDVVTSAYTGNRIEWFESIPANSGDFDGDGDVDGRDFLAWQRGASPTPVAGNDLADWQATYGYTAPEPPAAFQGDRAETASVIAAVSAVDEVLAEAVIAPAPGGFILPSPSTARVSRSSKILLRPVTHLHHDRVFAELAAPSRTFIRDFGDIVIRRTMPERFSISGSCDE